MAQNIINIAKNFLRKDKSVADYTSVRGIWKRTITRADGSEEIKMLENLVVAEGLNALASRVHLDTTSRFGFMAIGTVTDVASLGSDVLDFGEIGRKALSTLTSSAEVSIAVTTWAGNLDSLTGIPLGTASVVNHVNSGLGVSLNQVNGISATLADSDFLKLEVTVQIGSHAI
jgi:hypothetical protein